MAFHTLPTRQLITVIIPLIFTLFTSGIEHYSTHRARLLHYAISWGLIAIFLLLRTGLRQTASKKEWQAGFLLGVSQIILRAATERPASRWASSIIPLVAFCTYLIDLPARYSFYAAPDQETAQDFVETHGKLSIATLSVFALLSHGYCSPGGSILVLAGSALFAISIVKLRQELEDAYLTDEITGKESESTMKSLRNCWISAGSSQQVQIAIRNIAGLVSVLCIAASFWIERPYFSPMARMPDFRDLRHVATMHWQQLLYLKDIDKHFGGVAAGVLHIVLLLVMLSQSNAVAVSFLYTGGVALYASMTSQGISRLTLLVMYAIFASQVCQELRPSSIQRFQKWQQSRRRAVSIAGGLLLIAILIWQYVEQASPGTQFVEPLFSMETLVNSTSTREILDRKVHPIEQLVKQAKKDFENKLGQQSTTLREAVSVYQRKYGLPPPPKFDIWYEFARGRNVQMIDEFDTIHQMLIPYWALSPKVLRERVAESLGFANSLMGVLIRNGAITHVDASNFSSSLDWQKESLVGMMQSFVQHLPDMNLAFNLHDEPRVIIPHDTLSRMVDAANNIAFPEVNADANPKNQFSTRSKELGPDNSITEVRTSRFNKFARQHTWSHSRLSCSPESPSRDFTELAGDNMTAYGLGDLGFIYNTTAFSDICQTPFLRQTFGFFDRPNVFNIIQDLVPIFSQSKISSFQDLLYPSPWYWADRVPYNEQDDLAWDKKNTTIYWRGSTTGGFSRKGGWRRHHRQRVVRIFNHQNTVNVLSQTKENQEWHVRTTQRDDYSSLVDVAFSGIGQCDPSDCIAQQEFFHIKEPEPQETAWSSRLLLDMDGNAFSGRFISFLRSKSLVLKLAIFREWHAEWLQPWVHYVPISLKGDEWIESVRYLAGGVNGDKGGETIGRAMAENGRDWAKQSMRKEDMEVWFFRLLLEYGRLMDDDRSRIGFTGT